MNFENLQNTIVMAVNAILVNKSRSFLTVLGVIIGVGSVVLLTSIGTGLQSYVTDQFSSLGANVLYVVPGNPFASGGGGGRAESAVIESTKPVLKRKDMERILRNNRDYLRYGVASGFTSTEGKYGSTTKKVTLYGVTSSFPVVQNFNTQAGRWFGDLDEARGQRVVVIGSKIAQELFGNVDPLNKKVKLNGQAYLVVGLLEKKGGGFGGPNFDNYIYLPLNTLFDNFNTQLVDSFTFQAVDRDTIPLAKAAIEKELLKDLKKDDFTVFDQTELLKTINNILGVLTAGLGGISAISLVVGGIGIMNIMLVSVTERTKEIGLRKALGATPSIILLQFLIEAALLSLFGGMIGVAIAFLGTLAIQSFFPAKILPEAIALAFGVSTAVGLVFGAAPARRASKLSPIEALRSE